MSKYKVKPPANVTQQQDSKDLDKLVTGLSLEALMEEISILKFLKVSQDPSFQEKLLSDCYDHLLTVQKGRPVLTDDDTGERIELSKKLEEAFIKIHENPQHWLFKVCKYTNKEVMLLLYRGKLAS